MNTELFVWYRLDSTALDVGAVENSAQALMCELHTRFGVMGRLLKRADAQFTWMEHYALKSHNQEDWNQFQEVLSQLEKTLWLPPLPQRHCERFERIECAPT